MTSGFGGEQFGLGDAAVDASEDAASLPWEPSSQGGNPWWSAESVQVGGFLVVVEADDLHLRRAPS